MPSVVGLCGSPSCAHPCHRVCYCAAGSAFCAQLAEDRALARFSRSGSPLSRYAVRRIVRRRLIQEGGCLS